MTSAKVYRIVGDPGNGNAILDGMKSALPSEQLAAVKREIKTRSLQEALEGVKKPRELREMTQKIIDARLDYADQEELKGLRKKLLQIWALTWYGIDMAYRKLSAINREP